jgi:biopolymer transport protein ExbB/TolQ
MKTWLTLLFGLIGIVVLIWALSAAAGLLSLVMWGVVVAAIGALILAVVRSAAEERPRRRIPRLVARYRSSRRTDRALQRLRREVDAEQRRDD